MSKHFNQCKGHVKCCEIFMWKFGITHGFACTTGGLYNINNTFFYLFVVIQSDPTKKCWTRFVNVCVIESDKVLFPLWKDQTPRLIKDRKTKNHYPHNQHALELTTLILLIGKCSMLICLIGWPWYVILFLIGRYVKEKRITISPNFNFLGQLLEYEQQMEKEGSCQFSGSKRRCIGECDVTHLLPQCFYFHTV